MKKNLYFISIVCVLLMVGSCKPQHALSAYDSLRHNDLTLFYAVVYHPAVTNPSTLILTQGGKPAGFGTWMQTSPFENSATMGEWKLVEDTIYIYPAFNVHPTDTNMLKTTQLIQGIDTVTARFKVIGDGLYDITDLTEFNNALEKDLGVALPKYQYEPDLVYPAYRMSRISKDKRKGY